jgi:hypothetical protein
VEVPAVPQPPSADKQAILRLKNEIAKDRARLAQQLALLADEEPAGDGDASTRTTGRLSRVFSLMSA